MENKEKKREGSSTTKGASSVHTNIHKQRRLSQVCNTHLYVVLRGCTVFLFCVTSYRSFDLLSTTTRSTQPPLLYLLCAEQSTCTTWRLQLRGIFLFSSPSPTSSYRQCALKQTMTGRRTLLATPTDPATATSAATPTTATAPPRTPHVARVERAGAVAVFLKLPPDAAKTCPVADVDSVLPVYVCPTQARPHAFQ